MSNHRLSRREFLELMSLAASAAALGACTPSTPVAVTATPSPEPPTPTPLPPPTTVTEPDGFEMVLVEAGSFEMGSATGFPNERPVHLVNITRSFFMSKHEVTFALYDQFCEDTGSPSRDDHGMGRGNHPVIVNWPEAVLYCNWLSERAGFELCYDGGNPATIQCDFQASGYRLPTEAEWEYAARGGARSQGYLYAGSNDHDEVAWYADNTDLPQAVGELAPNELGLYDLSGNVREWCWDWYQRDYYAESPTDDPTGPASSSSSFGDAMKVIRSGHFNAPAEELTVSFRLSDRTQFLDWGNGIRLVRTA